MPVRARPSGWRWTTIGAETEGRQQGPTLFFNTLDAGLLLAVDEADITDLVLDRYKSAAENSEDG